jgi:hypothetical protein
VKIVTGREESSSALSGAVRGNPRLSDLGASGLERGGFEPTFEPTFAQPIKSDPPEFIVSFWVPFTVGYLVGIIAQTLLIAHFLFTR